MGKRQITTRMVAIMTFEMPEYYNQSKPKPDKEEVLMERKCFICSKKAKMGKFERFCSIRCRSIATRLERIGVR